MSLNRNVSVPVGIARLGLAISDTLLRRSAWPAASQRHTVGRGSYPADGRTRSAWSRGRMPGPLCGARVAKQRARPRHRPASTNLPRRGDGGARAREGCPLALPAAVALAERRPATDDDDHPHGAAARQSRRGGGARGGLGDRRGPRSIRTLGLPKLLADAGDSATGTTLFFAFAALLIVAAMARSAAGAGAGWWQW